MAHCHDDLIGMVKICSSAVVKPLSNHIWKKSNLFSVYKKEEKHCLQNHRPTNVW